MQLRTALIVLICLSSNIAAARAGDYDPDARKGEFTTMDTIWHDGPRDRDVPVKIYLPKSDGKSPVIIFSHGLGGSREGYTYLGVYWASHGYVSVHLTHKGSDTDAIAENGMENLKKTAVAISVDPMNAYHRFKDVSFAIDQLTQENKDEKSPLYGKLDLDHIGMSGHSFGAETTMVMAGELTHSGKSFADDRIKCAIAMSPPMTVKPANQDGAFSEIKMPVFVMTGTKDDSPVGETKAADRRVPFDHISQSPVYLLTFEGGDHMLFSASHRRPKWPTDDRNHELIQQGSVAFWDAYLKSNADAKTWLAEGGYAKAVGDSGKFEEKNTKTP